MGYLLRSINSLDLMTLQARTDLYKKLIHSYITLSLLTVTKTDNFF